MKDRHFEYGPLARGTYIAMLWFTVLVAWVAPGWLLHYVALLIFLGLGLRPLLEWSGMALRCQELMAGAGDWRHRKRDERRLQVEIRERGKKYRYSHYRDPRLPPNW